ncbi:MAG: hypothetical protein AB7I50_20485 [Vicinamibacterales bacterium]
MIRNQVTRGHPFAVALLLTVVLGAMTTAAQMSVPTGRDTLRGLPGVEVLVEPLDTAVQRAGLSQSAIQSDVEARLRSKGITVFATQADNPSPAKAYLYVHVNAIALPENGGFAVAVQLQVRQTLRSLVTNSIVVNAMTWDAHNVVVAPASALPEIRTEILSYVDLFVRDWLATHGG